MPDSAFLGEFDQLVLLALARLRDQGYGVTIQEEIEARTGRDVAVGTVYRALDRLERRGYVSSRLGEPTGERGGRAKRYYQLAAAGARALARSREAYIRLWEGLTLDPESFG